MDIYRSAGYPLFIALHKFLFGSKYISFLIFRQFVLIIYSVFNLKNKIALHLKLSKRQSFFILLLLLAPVFYEIKVINVVLSEALAYPLYLLIVGNLFDFIATKHFKNIVYSCLLFLILIQVRGQFMFLVVVMLFAVLISKEPLSKIDFYFENYVKISNRTVGDNGELFFKDKSAIDELVIENDKMASSITIPLIKNNFLIWSKLYFQNIIKGLGNYLILILIIAMLLFSFLKQKKDQNIFAKFILIGTLLILGNVAIVALAEPTSSRYLFYNNWILLSIFMLLFQLSFYKNR